MTSGAGPIVRRTHRSRSRPAWKVETQVRDGQGAATVQVPDQVVQLVYGRFGFSAEHTAVLGYRAPYVLLATPRRGDPYSIVDTTTGLTVERYAEPDAATARLDDLAS